MSEQHDNDLKEKTGGHTGQAGYDNQFEQGVYKNSDTAAAGDVSDRAGSYEDGYATPDRSSALPAGQSGVDTSHTNYTDPGADNQPARAVKEE